MKTYEQLLSRSDAPKGSAWGLFGADDEAGTVNLLTPERVMEAARLVRRGAVFGLDYPLDAFDPPVSRTRRTASHTVFGNSPFHRDDYLDQFFLQASSHIDGLRHMHDPRYGFYNGRPADQIGAGTPTLGVNRWAEKGIVGRGVLADVDAHLRRSGRPLDHRGGDHFSVSEIEGALAEQGTRLLPGDVLLLRTGWASFYLEEMSAADRRALSGHLVSPGLEQSERSVAWLWDHEIAMVASDNAAVECVPPLESSPFGADRSSDAGVAHAATRLMHGQLIGLLGLVIGELWRLDELARDCAADGCYEFLLVCKPLNLVGGVGSPANAVAIK
jgi:kynurenine formamidase